MESLPVVLDLSSDEEEEEEEMVCSEENTRGRRSVVDLDWIKEFLGVSDEVAVLHEPNKHQHKSKSKSSISTPSVDDDDGDDDCVVLDSDPESRVTTVDDSPTGSDELVVVGEKGQIACRDYPHPRHLCVKFPYSSTAHEKYCDQCHCYVCDAVAPCPKWGTGNLGTDHCHATEKYGTWKTLRKNFKLGKTALLPASTNYSTLSDVRNAHQNHILPFGAMLLSPNSLLPNQTSMLTATHSCPPVNFTSQNQASRPNTVPQCFMATNLTIPSGTNHGRDQESGSTLTRNRYQSQSSPQHSLGVRNRAIQRVRHGVSTLGPQFHHPHRTLNGLGSVSVGSTVPMNHSTNGASFGFINHVNPAQQYPRYQAATGFSNNGTCYGSNIVYPPENLVYPNPCSQPNNLGSVSSTAHETQASYQSNGSQNLYAYSVQGYNAPSSNVAGPSRNLMGNQNENAYVNVTQNGTTRHYTGQQKLHDASLIECALKADFSAFDSSRIENTNQSILRHQQSSGSTNISSSTKEFTGSTGLGSIDDIERWLFSDENSVPVGADGALASEQNMPSPNLSTFDENSFFDFESSWNCLAHV